MTSRGRTGSGRRGISLHEWQCARAKEWDKEVACASPPEEAGSAPANDAENGRFDAESGNGSAKIVEFFDGVIDLPLIRISDGPLN